MDVSVQNAKPTDDDIAMYEALSNIVYPQVRQLCETLIKSKTKVQMGNQSFSDLEFDFDPFDVMEASADLGNLLTTNEIGFNTVLGYVVNTLIKETMEELCQLDVPTEEMNAEIFQVVLEHTYFCRSLLINGLSLDQEASFLPKFPVLIAGSVIAVDTMIPSIYALTYTCGHRIVDKIHMHSDNLSTIPSVCEICGDECTEDQSQREMMYQCLISVCNCHGETINVSVKGNHTQGNYLDYLGKSVLCVGRVAKQLQIRGRDQIDITMIIQCDHVIDLSQCRSSTSYETDTSLITPGRHDNTTFENLNALVLQLGQEANIDGDCHWSLRILCLLSLVSGRKGMSLAVIGDDLLTNKILTIAAALAPHQVVHHVWNSLGPTNRPKSSWTDAGSILMASGGVLRVPWIDHLCPGDKKILENYLTRSTVILKLNQEANMHKQKKDHVVEHKTHTAVWATVPDQRTKDDRGIHKFFDIIYRVPPPNQEDDLEISNLILDTCMQSPSEINESMQRTSAFDSLLSHIEEARALREGTPITSEASTLIQGYYMVYIHISFELLTHMLLTHMKYILEGVFADDRILCIYVSLNTISTHFQMSRRLRTRSGGTGSAVNVSMLSIKVLLDMTASISALNGQIIAHVYDACFAILLFEESMVDLHGYSILGLRKHRRSHGSVLDAFHTFEHTAPMENKLEQVRLHLYKCISPYM